MHRCGGQALSSSIRVSYLDLGRYPAILHFASLFSTPVCQLTSTEHGLDRGLAANMRIPDDGDQ